MPANHHPSLPPEKDIRIFPDGTTDKLGVAKYFGVSPHTVDNWIAGRKIPYQRRSARMLRFKISEVERVLNKLTVKERS